MAQLPRALERRHLQGSDTRPGWGQLLLLREWGVRRIWGWGWDRLSVAGPREENKAVPHSDGISKSVLISHQPRPFLVV